MIKRGERDEHNRANTQHCSVRATLYNLLQNNSFKWINSAEWFILLFHIGGSRFPFGCVYPSETPLLQFRLPATAGSFTFIDARRAKMRSLWQIAIIFVGLYHVNEQAEPHEANGVKQKKRNVSVNVATSLSHTRSGGQRAGDESTQSEPFQQNNTFHLLFSFFFFVFRDFGDEKMKNLFSGRRWFA